MTTLLEKGKHDDELVDALLVLSVEYSETRDQNDVHGHIINVYSFLKKWVLQGLTAHLV